VPGPSSSTGPVSGPISHVIRAASPELDGVAEPERSGASVQAMRRDKASFAGTVTSLLMRAIRLGLHFDEALFAAIGLHEHCEAQA